MAETQPQLHPARLERAIYGSRSRGHRLFVAQGLNRIETGGEVRGNKRGDRADEKCANTNDSDISRDDFRGDRRKLINFAREDLDVQGRCEPVTELVAVTD